MAKTYYRAVLPSGRAVKFKRLSTRDYLNLQQRVAAKVGDRKDPGGGLARTLAAAETVATGLLAITLDPLPWQHVKPAPAEPDDDADDVQVLDADASPEVDVDAMLDDADADAGKRWSPVTYGDVMKKDGPLAFDTLFEEIADFEMMVALVTGMTGKEDPAKGKNLLGKAQARSEG